MTRIPFELVVEGTGEVTPAPDPTCVDVHPGEPCTGLPHTVRGKR